MKKIFGLFLLLILSAVTVSATNRAKSGGEIKEGFFSTIGGSTADTIVVSDTVSYTYQVSHASNVSPELNLMYTKVSSGTATLKVDILQSINGTDYYTVKKGKYQGAYTKSLTLSATGLQVISFQLDTAYFAGRYLKVQYSTSSTASVKGKLTNYLKINIK
jgi:hypothetical protein